MRTGRRHAICRRAGAPLCGRPTCPVFNRPYPPGAKGARRRRGPSQYALRLAEKQKLRAIYNVGERELRHDFDRARRAGEATGVELLRMLETRLDTLVLRLGMAMSIRHARQLVTHGHVQLDGRKVTVPAQLVRPGQRIALRAGARNTLAVREALEENPRVGPYLERAEDGFSGALLRRPERGEIPLPTAVDERLVVEYYS